MKARNAGNSGFTLVELMVAVTGGLFVTIAVFMLAKQSTSLYQSEARISNATVSSLVGFERLKTDIARAGFLATPNAAQDPRYCGQPPSTIPLLGNLAAVSIQRLPASSIPPLLAANGVSPDQIILAGSYTTTDQFPIAAFDAGVITLQVNSPPMARLTGGGAVTDVLLQSVFQAGSALRVMDGTGRIQFGIVQAVQLAGALPQIVLAGAPTVYQRSGSPYKCGVAGEGAGSVVSPVQFIRYSLQDVTANPLFASIAAGPGAPPTDLGRTELVREQLTPLGAPIPGTQEVVAEFAVDLAFGITIANNSGGGLPQLQYVGPNDPATIAQWAGNPATLAGTPNQGPQRVRSVRARLSIRSREADRTADFQGATAASAGRYRFGVGPAGGAPFARVRTVEADIALRNSRDSSW